VSSSRALDDLVLRVGASRDREAFAGLFDHYAPRIKALLIRGGASVSAAEELAQETLLVVWRKAHLYDRSQPAHRPFQARLGHAP
jgi:RNA polymerase sigma-70 factor (ECF subfamily)